MTEDKEQQEGVSAEADRAGHEQSPQAVSAVPVGIPSAGDLGQRCADSISPDLFAPLVKRVSEDIYERLLDTVQDYLCDNSEWNIAQRIATAEGEAKRLREEMFEVDKALGFASWLGTRAEQIAVLQGHSTRYQNLIYGVACKHEGEDRYQTALRYIRERESAQGTEARSDETEGLGPKGDGPVRASECAQPSPGDPS